MARNSYQKDVVNTQVGQAELIQLQVELFAAAKEALGAARESGAIPASLLTSCHQIIKDSGLVADAQGSVGDTEEEKIAQDMGVSVNWLRNAVDIIDEMDLDAVTKVENI